MFVRKKECLPPDPKFPADLKELGLFLSPTGRFQSIEHPAEGFTFRITNSTRHNEMHREALHEVIREEVSSRLEGLGLVKFYVPNLSTVPSPAPATSLAIYMTPPKLLRSKANLVVIVNKSAEDLGIVSYRDIIKGGGIDAGSVTSIIKGIRARACKFADAHGLDREEQTPGFVVLNTGQLLYSHKRQQAVTPATWMASPRQSAVHPPAAIHKQYNCIRSNTTITEHIDFVFNRILANRDFTAQDVHLHIIGIMDGGEEVIKHLLNTPVEHKLAALAITGPVPVLPATSSIPLVHSMTPFLHLLRCKVRAWCLSDESVGTPLANPTDLDGLLEATSDDSVTKDGKRSMEPVALYPMVSGGHSTIAECILPAALSSILDWFDEVSKQDLDDYKNPIFSVSEEMQKLTLGIGEHQPQTWEGFEEVDVD